MKTAKRKKTRRRAHPKPRLNPLCTTAEAAEYLGVSAGRVRQFIIDSRIPSQKFGHIRLLKSADVRAFSRKRRAVGRPIEL